ncbi:MAG: hypothetical protein ACLUKN_05940 [Bacilli bacterium]
MKKSFRRQGIGGFLKSLGRSATAQNSTVYTDFVAGLAKIVRKCS